MKLIYGENMICQLYIEITILFCTSKFRTDGLDLEFIRPHIFFEIETHSKAIKGY